jgi:hypothetical protein
MYQGGTRDFGVTPELKRRDGAYDQTPEPKYFVELDHAGHFEWTDIRRGMHKEIVAYALAFLNRHLKGAGDDTLLNRAVKGVATYRFDTEPGGPDPQEALIGPRPSLRERLRQRLGM